MAERIQRFPGLIFSKVTPMLLENVCRVFKSTLTPRMLRIVEVIIICNKEMRIYILVYSLNQ